MGTRDCDTIKKQHQIIQEKVEKLLGLLDQIKKNPSEVDLPEIETNLKQVGQLMEAHSACEEQILLPILKEMYQSQPEILQYVVEDHEVIEKELSNLMNSELTIQENLGKIKSLLNRITVHFVEEENGLLPLVEMFLQAKSFAVDK